MITRLPSIHRFIKSYVTKEALLSSEIENIHTTLLEIFTASLEDTQQTQKDTQLVLNYIKTAEYATQQIKEHDMPLTNRLLMYAHEMLLGETQADAGLYRRHAVRVGNFVPAPPQQVPELMNALEQFINTDQSLSALLQAGLVHVQFETIHPFSDGNGRIGRLLIVLLLIKNGLINLPIIYPSYYFKKNKLEYYLHYKRATPKVILRDGFIII